MFSLALLLQDRARELLAKTTGIKRPADVIAVNYLDRRSKMEYEAGMIPPPKITTAPLTILDLEGGELSMWNAEIIRDVASILRQASVAASPSRRDEGMDYYKGIVQQRIKCFCDAWKESTPRGKSNHGEMETREEAWDRFGQQWGPISSKARQTARLVAV